MSPSVSEGVLTPDLYRNLRRIASRYIGMERSNHTLQATALVHEAYLKLVAGSCEREFEDESHFLAVSSRFMRQILVDYARSRAAQKRLGAHSPEFLSADPPEPADLHGAVNLTEIIELDRALTALGEENPTLARLIEMRYFGGLTAEESAEALGLSVHVVRHNLRFAQAWLRKRLSS